MAFALQGTAATSQTDPASTTHVIALPDGIQTGERLRVYASFRNIAQPTLPTGWDEIHNGNGSGNGTRLWAIERIIDGTEGFTGTGDTLTVTTNTSQTGAHLAERWTGHSSTTSESSTGVQYSSTAPDPDSVTPSWGTKATLFTVILSQDHSRSFTAPTGYTQATSSTVANNNGICVAHREVSVSSEDPSAVTLGGAANGRVATLAMEPSGGGSGSSAVYDPIGGRLLSDPLEGGPVVP